MPRKLKVFRTPTGFHDAYVAAPSRKAALAAWGASADLFARGAAEEVTDPRLMAAPLKRPGEVVRISRGDLQAQLKALGTRKPAKRTEREEDAKPAARERARRAPPKRDKVDRAEAALAGARAKEAKEMALLEKQRDALERKIHAAGARQAKALSRLEERLEKAKADYRAALEEWSG